MRGHMLVWEHTNWWDEEMRGVYNDTSLADLEKGERLIELAEAHFHHAVPKWDVDCWDVMNKPLNNYLINDLVPMNTFTHWYKLADELRQVHGRPDMQLFINDYQIISGIAKLDCEPANQVPRGHRPNAGGGCADRGNWLPGTLQGRWTA